jgi:hypothetical protein
MRSRPATCLSAVSALLQCVRLDYAQLFGTGRFYAGVISQGRTYDFVPTRANGQPAFGAYLRDPSGIRHGTGLIALTLTGDRICATTRFEAGVLSWFGMPRLLPG